MLTIKDINQSFSHIESDIPDMYSYIMQKLTFQVPNYQFTPEFRSGNWDGSKKFFRVYNGSLIIPKGMIPQLLKQLQQYNPQYVPIEKQYYKNPTFIEFIQWVRQLDIPFEPYDYQIQCAYDSVCKKRQTNILATSAGKSLIIYMITRWLYEHNIKTVLVFPSIILVEQIKKDYISYVNFKQLNKDYEKLKNNWDKSLAEDDLIELENRIRCHNKFINDIHQIGGDHKERSFEKPITATTWQSVYDHPKMFNNIPAIVIDEVHKAKSNSFQSITSNCLEAGIRFGFTGTLPPHLVDKIEIISSMGPKKTYITAQQLIERGLATPVTINCCFLKYNEYDSNRINNLGYQDEIKTLYNHTGRLRFIEKLLNKLQQSGNTLVLFDRIELAENVIMKLHEDKGPFFDPNDLRKVNEYKHMLITSKTKSSERTNILNFMENNDNCLTFGTNTILSTGVSVKRLKNLVFLRANRSPIEIIQSIGRLLRMHPEIDKVHAYDLIDDCRVYKQGTPKNNYCYTHFEERLGYYIEAGYPLKEINIDIT